MIDITIGNYVFSFKELSWWVESNLQVGCKDARRVVLASALVEVSGLPIENFEDAETALNAIGLPIIHRVFLTYKSRLTKSAYRIAPLYQAPKAKSFQIALQEQEQEIEAEVDSYFQDRRFSRADLEEARKVDQAIIRKSGMKGATRVSRNE
jgi:hypothetical protein